MIRACKPLVSHNKASLNPAMIPYKSWLTFWEWWWNLNTMLRRCLNTLIISWEHEFNWFNNKTIHPTLHPAPSVDQSKESGCHLPPWMTKHWVSLHGLKDLWTKSTKSHVTVKSGLLHQVPIFTFHQSHSECGIYGTGGCLLTHWALDSEG